MGAILITVEPELAMLLPATYLPTSEGRKDGLVW